VRQAHRVLALAVRDEGIARNPAERVGLPRLHVPAKRYLSHSEVTPLANACGPYRLAVLVLAYCGLRWGEFAALRVSQLDLMRRRLEVAQSVTEMNGRAVFGSPRLISAARCRCHVRWWMTWLCWWLVEALTTSCSLPRLRECCGSVTSVAVALTVPLLRWAWRD
jgi:integrase